MTKTNVDREQTFRETWDADQESFSWSCRSKSRKLGGSTTGSAQRGGQCNMHARWLGGCRCSTWEKVDREGVGMHMGDRWAHQVMGWRGQRIMVGAWTVEHGDPRTVLRGEVGRKSRSHLLVPCDWLHAFDQWRGQKKSVLVFLYWSSGTV